MNAGVPPSTSDYYLDVVERLGHSDFLYPFPSFKYGYSVLMAAVEYVVGDGQFNSIFIPAITNAILLAGIFVTFYLVLFRICNSFWIAFSSTIFLTTSPFLISTAFRYFSHTLAGIFFLLIAALLFSHRGNVGKLSHFGVGLSGALAVLSSSHVLFIGAALGLTYAASTMKKDIRAGSLNLAISCIGLMLPFAYIFWVESKALFDENNISTFFDSQFIYLDVVGRLINQYPLGTRSLSPDIWNGLWFVYAIPVLAALFKFTKTGVLDKRKRPIDIFIVFLAFFTAHAVYNHLGSQPLIGAEVTLYLLFGLVVVSAILYVLPTRLSILALILASAIQLPVTVYQNKMAYWDSLVVSGSPTECIGKSIHQNNLLWPAIDNYNRLMGDVSEPSGQFGKFSQSLEVAKEKRSENEWIEMDYFCFDPMRILERYTHQRRTKKAFIHAERPENLVTMKTINEDFRLIFEALGSDCYQVIPRLIWFRNPSIFDQEFNYVDGVMGHLGKETNVILPFDFRYTYVFRNICTS